MRKITNFIKQYDSTTMTIIFIIGWVIVVICGIGNKTESSVFTIPDAIIAIISLCFIPLLLGFMSGREYEENKNEKSCR